MTESPSTLSARARRRGESSVPALPRLSYAEFLAWADEDTPAEWVDGEVHMTSPASDRHQDVSGFLESILRAFVEVHQLGIVRSAPFQMKLARSGREPDLLFVAAAHLERLKPTYLDGPADLVVEILSPESAGRDRGDKFFEYEEAGIDEYWLVDPVREQAEFYRLMENRYTSIPVEPDGVYRSAILPGFWLQVDQLWRQPLPPVLDMLRALRLI